jgi:branched-chain amino acid transport system permease protein
VSDLAVQRGSVTWGRRGTMLVVAIVLLGLPTVTNDYTQYVVNTILVYSLATAGFNILLGYVGQLAFSNATFFGTGAYATAIGMSRLGLPFPVALLGSAVLGAVVGALVGLPALRVRRYALAIVTLAIGELLRWGYIHADWLTAGSSGLEVPPIQLFGIQVVAEKHKYFLFLAVTAVTFWVLRNVMRSRLGRSFVAIRDNELATAALGLSPALCKIGAFALSGTVVGIAGGLFAVLLGRVEPASFDLSQLLLGFSMVVVGGLGSLLGSALGAILLTALPELLRNIPGMEEIAFSLLLMGCLVFLPDGLAGLAYRLWPALRGKLYWD